MGLTDIRSKIEEVGRKRENLIFFVRQEKLVNLVSRPKTGLDTRFTSIFCAARKTKFSRFLPEEKMETSFSSPVLKAAYS